MSVHDSPLVRMTEVARRPTQWWLAWLVVMVIAVVVGPLGFVLGNAVLGDPASASPWFRYVETFGYLATLLALFLWVRFKERRPFATVGFRPKRDGGRLLLGFGIGAALTSVAVVVGLLTGLYADGQSTHARSGVQAILPLLPLVLLFLLQGASQEALLRGYLLPMSLRQLPAWVGIVGTSALVAVLHSLNAVSLVNAFLYATIASLVALQQGSLWLVVGIQAGWSFFQINVFGMPVGGVTDATALWSIGPASDSSAYLISGGSFGLDTGLLGTVVLSAATVLAAVSLRWAARTSPHAPNPAPAEATNSKTTSRREQTHVTNHV